MTPWYSEDLKKAAVILKSPTTSGGIYGGWLFTDEELAKVTEAIETADNEIGKLQQALAEVTAERDLYELQVQGGNR